MDLVVHCTKLVRGFPGTEKYDLCYKMRQCVHEIPSSVARAMRFRDSLYFLYHMNSAYSRLLWLETDLELAESLDYVTQDEAAAFREHTEMVRSMIRGLIDSARIVSAEKRVLVESLV
jgi:four helix bundle protein